MKKRRLFWIVNFSVLTLFSMYTLASTFALGSHKAYAETLSRDDFHKKSHHFVVVDNDDDKDSNDHDKDKHKHKPGAGGSGEVETICTLNDRQVAELDAFFKVDTFQVNVNGDVVTIAAVSGKHLTKKELKDFLKASDQTLECKIVERHHVFFLPVLPQIS